MRARVSHGVTNECVAFMSWPAGMRPQVLLQVLCTTTTLALGVNLPAHLVVVKSTRRWTQNGGVGGASGYEEYDRSSCLQMLGRCRMWCIAHLAFVCTMQLP